MNKLFPFLLLIILSSCIPVQKLKYTINKEGSKNKYYNDRSEKTIQPYDYLYIKIYSLDPKTSSIFETDYRAGNASSEQLISYGVDNRGYIEFPFTGSIYVKDLTILEAKQKIEESLNQYLTGVSIRVRFVSNKITIIGEVNRPGNYSFYDEKITIFQGLALANDISDFGDKTNVTILREKDNQINYNYLDLTNKNIAESEFYYLLPNDIVIVDPVKAKYRSLRDYTPFYLFSTMVTTSIAIYSLFK